MFARPWLYCHRVVLPGPFPFTHDHFDCVSLHQFVLRVVVDVVFVCVVVEVVRRVF